LARAGAALEDITGSEPVLLLVAIQDISPLTRIDLLILPNFTACAVKSFYQFHHNCASGTVSGKRASTGFGGIV
jgi:hypothetical protein